MGAPALWRSLPAAHRRWIVLNALVATALINLVVNALVAWFSVRSQSDVPFWARPLSETSLLGDTLGTIFLLPLITCLLATTAVRRELRNGSLAPLVADHPHVRRLAGMPNSRVQRGLAFAAVAFAVLALPVALALAAIDLGTLTKGEFVIFKAAFAILLGALITPLIALAAMTDRQ
ncbi:MAG: hypothetical protein ACRDKV_06220 [Solirubrobacterales bacterium]